jgi:hypothetical protein
MSQETQVLETLYTALQARDYQTMAGLYHPEATFEDEVFELCGKEIGAMWHMLCSRGKDMQLTFDSIRSEKPGYASAHWEPIYTFSMSGRKVHNRIDTEIELKDGKIWKQRDHFSFWRWSSQALGVPGLLLGWTPLLRRKVSATANKSLQDFMAKQAR